MHSALCIVLALTAVGAADATRHLKRAAKPSDAQMILDAHAQQLLREHVTAAIGGFELQAGDNQVKAPMKGAAGDKVNQPVAVQVDEKTMEKLQKELSPKCSARFSSMMEGKGPAMHNFKDHKVGKSSSKQCEKLQGKICVTEAAVLESYTHHDGRKLSQEVEVTGNGCLPSECTSQKDIETLATFMHKQTEEMVASHDTTVELRVDCSLTGGGVVHLGKKGQKTVPEPKAKKSAASTLGLGAAAAAVLLLAN